MTKQEVLEAYSDVSEYWKEKLKTKYPEYFQETFLEEGKIYTFENIIFQYYNNPTIYWFTKDFDHASNFGKGYFETNSKYCKLVEDGSIIDKFLIAEAKRRGFKVGVKVNRSDLFTFQNDFIIPSDTFEYSKRHEALQIGGWFIFEKGIWSEIIKE